MICGRLVINILVWLCSGLMSCMLLSLPLSLKHSTLQATSGGKAASPTGATPSCTIVSECTHLYDKPVSTQIHNENLGRQEKGTTFTLQLNKWSLDESEQQCDFLMLKHKEEAERRPPAALPPRWAAPAPLANTEPAHR